MDLHWRLGKSLGSGAQPQNIGELSGDSLNVSESWLPDLLKRFSAVNIQPLTQVSEPQTFRLSSLGIHLRFLNWQSSGADRKF